VLAWVGLSVTTGSGRGSMVVPENDPPRFVDTL
jgi:hypothetical protein